MQHTQQYMQSLGQKSLHILLTANSKQETAHIKEQLASFTPQKYQFTECFSTQQVLQRLAEHPAADCMIADMQLAGNTGNGLLLQVSRQFGHIPLPIIMLGNDLPDQHEDTSLMLEALRLGAQDYLSHTDLQPHTLARTIYNAIERYRLTQRLKEKDEQYRFAVEAAQLGTWRYDAATGSFDCSTRCLDILGLEPGAKLQLESFLGLIHPNDRETVLGTLRQTLDMPSHPNIRIEFRLRTEGTKCRWMNLRGRAQLEDGAAHAITGTLIDVSERRYAEALRQEDMEILDALYRLVQAFSSPSTDTEPLQFATDIATELTKAEFGIFFPRTDISTTLLYSGTAPAEHGDIPILEYIENGDDNLIRSHKAFKTVKSLILVPVMSQHREALGVLLFGHTAPNIFTERAQRIARAIASQLAVGIENERLVQSVRTGDQRWRHLAEVMPQLVWMARHDGACEYLSTQWEQYTGIPTAQIQGHNWIQTVHPDDRAQMMEAWQNAMEDRAAYNIEYRIRRHDGVYRWFKARAMPQRNEQGNIVTWYGTCTDIQELVESRDAAEAANIAKSEFLANMSHEIRTPMNAVIGLTNLLASSKPLTPRQQEFIETLELSANTLLSLINDLLDITKIEAHTIDLEEMPFSVVKLAEEVVSIMAIKAEEKGLTFSYKTSCECIHTHVFLGDPTRLRQIILNLCSNALKFTEQGGVEIDIQCEHIEDGRELVHIAVKDTGIGIPTDKLSSIFDKFVQADSSINRKYGGTGLGLAITKTLSEIMGGSIRAQSTLGSGSTFTVSVPLKRSLRESAIPAGIMPKRPDNRSESRPCILLVEDYAANILVASTFLDEFGYDCHVANNGIEAIEKIKNNHYILALMDVQMHGMNGLEATAHIRAHEKVNSLPQLPIIGMTAYALAGDRERCLNAGMNDYLAKPFNPEELQQKISRYANARELVEAP